VTEEFAVLRPLRRLRAHLDARRRAHGVPVHPDGGYATETVLITALLAALALAVLAVISSEVLERAENITLEQDDIPEP
jgi:hypothetical protein